MRFLFLLLLAGLFSQAQAIAPRPGASPEALPEWAVQLDDQPPCVRDRLMVRIKAEALPAGLAAARVQLTDLPALESFAREKGLKESRSLIVHELDAVALESGHGRDLVIELAPGSDLKAAQAAWAARPEVEWAEYDWLMHALVIPNDPYFSGQWALRNLGGGIYTNDCDIDAELAWDVTTGSTGIKIAIIDTGVDLDHPDLQAKIIAGYNFVSNNNNPNDDHMIDGVYFGHGTACASLAASITNNTTGMAGVDWNARIMPIKVLNSQGSGTTTAIINGVNWARTNGAHVISMSLGGGGFDNTFNTAVTNAYNAGIPVVCAAGNDNSGTVSYPAAYANAYAVGALAPCNVRKTPSSCDGEWWWGSNYGTALKIMAPGVLLRSAKINGYVTDMNGTSGATPHVAGAAALVRGINTGLSAQQVYDILSSTADDIGTAGWDNQTGWGRLNVHQAVLAANPDPCAGETVPPSITHSPLGDTSNTTTPYAVSATVTDNCTLVSVTLSWRVNGGTWTNAAMTANGSTWTGSIPAQSAGSNVQYQIVALDAASNTATGGPWSFNVTDPCLSDATGPAILPVVLIADTYDQVGPYAGLVSISDPCGLIFQAATFTVNGGASQNGTITPIGGDQFSVVIPGQAGPATIVWTVTSADASPFFNLSSQSWSFQVLDPCGVETEPPAITHTPLADSPDNTQPYAVTATVTDNCALASVTLRWQVNGGLWSSAAMGSVGDQYSGAIPAQAFGSLVHYQIVALDARANEAVADHSFSVVDPCASDQTGPAIDLDAPIADTPDTAGPYVGLVTLSDTCGLFYQAATFTVNGGPVQNATMDDLGGGQFSVAIPGQAAGSAVAWTVTAVDDSPNHNVGSQSWSFLVIDPCAADQTAPALEVVTPFADTQDTAGPYAAIFSAVDPCGVTVALAFTVDGGESQAGVVTPLDAGQYLAEIPGQAAGSAIAWTFTAADGSPAHNQAAAGGSFQILTIPIEEAPILAITWTGPGQVQLAWNEVQSATGYRIYGAPTSMGPWTLLGSTAATSAELPVLDNELRLFRVTAFN
ncbi:MAG: S8 family serine peptidase [bacterium]|jgi:thermitase|nr:S8 family serine peptidase [bacterium]